MDKQFGQTEQIVIIHIVTIQMVTTVMFFHNKNGMRKFPHIVFL